jgi:hypothetical protein
MRAGLNRRQRNRAADDDAPAAQDNSDDEDGDDDRHDVRQQLSSLIFLPRSRPHPRAAARLGFCFEQPHSNNHFVLMLSSRAIRIDSKG